MTVRCHCLDVIDLERRDRDAMYELLARHFDRTDRDRFEADLAEKQWVLQLADEFSGELCGFSTQTLLRFRCREQCLQALFSGDTIVDQKYWCETALIREWGRLVARLLKANPREPLYWFLISKGYRTYRFLPVFFREFYPRYDRAAPLWAEEILDMLGRSMFSGDYDAARGIVVAAANKDRLRPELARVEQSRLNDPHVRYFLGRNPGFVRGDELCCLAPLDFGNFTSAGIRLLDPVNRPAPLAVS